MITSAIKDHAECTGHDVAKTDVKILEKRCNGPTKETFPGGMALNMG